MPLPITYQISPGNYRAFLQTFFSSLEGEYSGSAFRHDRQCFIRRQDSKGENTKIFVEPSWRGERESREIKKKTRHDKGSYRRPSRVLIPVSIKIDVINSIVMFVDCIE